LRGNDYTDRHVTVILRKKKAKGGIQNTENRIQESEFLGRKVARFVDTLEGKDAAFPGKFGQLLNFSNSATF